MLFCLMLQWDAVEMMETSMTIVMSACLQAIILEIVAVMLMNSPLMVNEIRTMILLGLSLMDSFKAVNYSVHLSMYCLNCLKCVLFI